MGYNILITRRKDWSIPEKAKDITLDEWQAFIQSHRRLQPCESESSTTCACVDGDEDQWLQWCEGNIETKNPPPELLEMMGTIAAALRGKIQGEEGEIYLPNGEVVQAAHHATTTVYPLWLLMLCLFSIGCFLATMAAVLNGVL